MDRRERWRLAETRRGRVWSVADRIDRIGVPVKDHVGRVVTRRGCGGNEHRNGDQRNRHGRRKPAPGRRSLPRVRHGELLASGAGGGWRRAPVHALDRLS